MKPICVPCQRFYRPTKNGRFFTEMSPKSGYPKPGRAEPEAWKPYKVWAGDEWTCPDCGSTIIVGVGRKPVAEHYEPDFDKALRYDSDQPSINDC